MLSCPYCKKSEKNEWKRQRENEYSSAEFSVSASARKTNEFDYKCTTEKIISPGGWNRTDLEYKKDIKMASARQPIWKCKCVRKTVTDCK